MINYKSKIKSNIKINLNIKNLTKNARFLIVSWLYIEKKIKPIKKLNKKKRIILN